MLRVTDADMIMSDGHSLERLGATSDEILLPTSEDLGAHKDPVLSRAASMAITLDSVVAGKLFPFKWKT